MKATYKPLDRDTARRAFHGTSFDPEKRGDSQVEYHKGVFDELSAELGDFFTQEKADKLHELWTAYLYSHASVMSSMITGPANFPVARNEKRSNWADNKNRAIFDYCEKLKKWKKKAERRAAIESAGGELEIKRVELTAAKNWHETMKTANRIIRAAMRKPDFPTAETKSDLSEIGIEAAEVEKICRPNCFGDYGYESFRLTNSNARIKGAAARVAELERQEAAKESGIEPEVFEIEGGCVIYDYAENRINVKHNERPDRAVIDLIKSHGFRWSRNYSTWTRKMTPNAKFSTKQLIKKLQEVAA